MHKYCDMLKGLPNITTFTISLSDQTFENYVKLLVTLGGDEKAIHRITHILRCALSMWQTKLPSDLQVSLVPTQSQISTPIIFNAQAFERIDAVLKEAVPRVKILAPCACSATGQADASDYSK